MAIAIKSSPSKAPTWAWNVTCTQLMLQINLCTTTLSHPFIHGWLSYAGLRGNPAWYNLQPTHEA